MARACAAIGVPFLHISTDYVFDGSGDHPRAEAAETAPIGVYGRTKRDGESEVVAAGGQYAILRTSWVFSPHGRNFVTTMRRLGAERDRLSIVSDQIGGPTPASSIARALIRMAEAMCADASKAGIYHFAGAPDTSWAGFAQEIFAQSGMDVEVTEIATADYPTPARRPLNSRLHCAAISHDFDIPRPDWRAALRDVISELDA